MLTLSFLKFEPFVDQNVKLFYKRVEELYIEPKKPCDIHNWVQYCELVDIGRFLGFDSSTDFELKLRLTLSSR